MFESEHFRKQVGLLTFTPSVSERCEKTNAIGMYSKMGKYGGTYAHKDIAFEFAAAISPMFKLYLIKEFERLKQIENQNREWDIKRILTKNNYLIHTDAIKNYILPDSNYDMFRFVDKTKIHYDTTLDIYKDFNNEELLRFKENEEPEKLYHMPDFKNGKEYVIIKDDLFRLTQKGYLDKKIINEMGYKLRKNLLKY